MSSTPATSCAAGAVNVCSCALPLAPLARAHCAALPAHVLVVRTEAAHLHRLVEAVLTQLIFNELHQCSYKSDTHMVTMSDIEMVTRATYIW